MPLAPPPLWVPCPQCQMGEMRMGTALLLQQEQGALLREKGSHKCVGSETTAWQVGMGEISCFKGGMACPVRDRQDGFADK